MDLEKLIGPIDPDVLGEDLGELLQGVLEGRVRQFVFIAEFDDGCILDNQTLLQDKANTLVMVGALEMVKRDYLREHVDSRVEYKRLDDDDDEE